MAWSSRYDWKFVARASVVIALVFAALVSSWIGIEAERRGKEAVSEASVLARRAFDVAVRAHALEALHDRLLAVQARDAAAVMAAAERERHASGLAALRLELDQIGGLPLAAREHALLQGALQALEGHDRLAAVMRDDPDRGAASAGTGPGALPFKDSAASASHVAPRLLELANEISTRVGRAAAETSEAGERAQTLLIIFGSVSLLLALYLAHWLGEALAKAGQLMLQLAEMARVDGLTGLPNRRLWDEELVKGLDRARRTGRPCSIGLIDLDQFKRYNDTHGHQAGDRLLRDTAQSLAQRMRAGDLIARYGGEEFAVLLHGCDADNALKFFERLHGAMPLGQTFSAGVSHTEGREPGGDVLKRADEALYRAKAEGRDRTMAFRASEPAA